MKALILIVLLVMVSGPALARDTQLTFTYKEVMSKDDAKEKLNKGIKFYFGKTGNPAGGTEKGTYVANKKTNSVGKSDERACEWAFLSAMLSLQERAIREGGNAVIKIHSYYKKNTNIGESEFECGAGTFVTGVALRGTIVKSK
jgi:uncharacterized protein YbjQ (UPF0145 family)